MKNEGIIEKSVIPSIGDFIFMPFHSTCVCDAEVPLKDTVDMEALPYCLTKREELYDRISAMEMEMFSFRARLSNLVSAIPVSLSGRKPLTVDSCRVSATSRGDSGPSAPEASVIDGIPKIKAVTIMAMVLFIRPKLVSTSKMRKGLSLP